MTSASFGAFRVFSPLQVRDQNIFRQDASTLKRYREKPDIFKPYRPESPHLMTVTYPSASRNNIPYRHNNSSLSRPRTTYEPRWDEGEEWSPGRDGFLDLPEEFIPPRHGFQRRDRHDDIPKVPTDEITLPHGFVSLRDQDVVCGRGAPTLVHPGNQAYRNLIQQNETAYLCAKRADKPIIATKVIDVLNNRGVRFVRRERNSHGSGWVVLDDKKVYEKVCQSLREGAPELRRKLLASDVRTSNDRPRPSMERYRDQENNPPVLTP